MATILFIIVIFFENGMNRGEEVWSDRASA